MRHLRLFLFVAIALTAGFLLGQSYQIRQQPIIQACVQQGQRENTPVSFMFIFDQNKIVTADVPWKESYSVFDATKEITTQKNLKFDFKDYEDLGSLITQIGDKKNSSSGLYWQYWVNNQQVQTAANNYILKAGDVVNWQFRKSEQ